MRMNRTGLLILAMVAAGGAHADPLGFSWLQVSAVSLHRDQGVTGHGDQFQLNYALSNQAFMYLDDEQADFDAFRQRRYDFGVGISTDPAAGYVVFATVGWNHVGDDYPVLPGKQDHGFGAGVGIRSLLSDDWEMYAQVRYAHNDELDTQASASAGVLYSFSPSIALGTGVTVDSQQTGYMLNLRFNY